MTIFDGRGSIAMATAAQPRPIGPQPAMMASLPPAFRPITCSLLPSSFRWYIERRALTRQEIGSATDAL